MLRLIATRRHKHRYQAAKMKYEDTISLINGLEATLPVATWRVHGVQMWPVIRSRLLCHVFDDALGDVLQHSGRLKRISRRARAATRSMGSTIRNALRGASPGSAADVVIVTDGVATTRLQGQAFDVVADPLAEVISATGLKVRTWYTTYACPEPRHTDGVLVQWRLDTAQLAKVFDRRWIREESTDPAGYAEFLEALRVAGVAHEAVAVERVAGLASRIALMATRFETWLHAASPRLVFVNCYYSLEGAALMLACKRCGIMSIDMQHGVQGNLHFAYGAWANVPHEGYDLLPDRFWCWSETEVRTIRSWTDERNGHHVPMLGGNLWLDMWRDEGAALVKTSDEAVRAIVRIGTCVVLVTLQWGMTDETFLDPLIKLMVDAGESWTWWIRLHPVMSTRRGEIAQMLLRRGLKHALIDEPSDIALPALLRHAGVHLTHSSSATLEAAEFGVATVVASSYGAACFPELVRDGVVMAVESLSSELALPALLAQSTRRRKNSVRTAGPAIAVLNDLLARTTARPQGSVAMGGGA